MHTDQDILSIEDVAGMLRQDPAVIRGLIEKGDLPGRKIGGAWYVTRRQLVAFVEGDSPAQTASHDARTTPFRPGMGREDNSWTCGACRAENHAELVKCSRCGRGRITPLINYRRKWTLGRPA